MNQTQVNPLLSSHLLNQAETLDYEDVQIVSTFGAPQAEYAAIRKAVGMIDLPQRGLLQLTGKDRLPFLNNLLTSELVDRKTRTPMPAGQTRYSFFLNLKGRVVADLRVIELGERTLLEMDIRLVPLMLKVLDRYLFSEVVKMESMVGRLHEIALHGPEAIALIATDLGQSFALERDACATVRLIGTDVVIWRDDVCGTPGLHLIVPTPSAQMVWDHFATRYGQEIEKGRRMLRPVGWAAYNTTRIEAGRPLFGIDFELAEPSMPGKKVQTTASQAIDSPEPARLPGVLPAETGLMNHAVDLDKGCYLGQEIVARMHSRGQIARQLVGLRMKSDALPMAGAVLTSGDHNQVGVITSSTMSPILSDASIALGIVKKPHYTPGTVLTVPAEGAMHEVEVVELPFVK